MGCTDWTADCYNHSCLKVLFVISISIAFFPFRVVLSDSLRDSANNLPFN